MVVSGIQIDILKENMTIIDLILEAGGVGNDIFNFELKLQELILKIKIIPNTQK